MIMKSYQYITNTFFIIAVSVMAVCFGSVGIAFAQEISVDFGGGPLFSEADFLPGDAEVRTFTVSNLSADTKEVRLRTLSEANSGLAEVLMVEIERSGGLEYFNDTLLELFNRDFVALGTIAPGAIVDFDMSATFLPNSGNGYQGGTAAFAICVGFSGTNENCVTDTTDPGGNGGGGGGGSTSLVDTDDEDLPEGQIAGESTSTAPVGTLFTGPQVRNFIDLVRGMVLGDTATATTSTSSLPSTDEITRTQAQGTDTVADVLSGISCTLVWLLLLAAISLSWSLFEDRLGKRSYAFAPFFLRNAVFSFVYVIALVALEYFGILETFWWVFAGAWALMTGADYLFHKALEEAWSTRKRNLYYAGTALICALIGIFTSLLCVWMPFLAITLVSAVLFFIDDQRE